MLFTPVAFDAFLPTPQSGLATRSFSCHDQPPLPPLAHTHTVEFAVELASGGQLVQFSAAPSATVPPTLLAKVLAVHVHVVWPAEEEAPAGHATHCSAPVVALLTAKEPAAQPHLSNAALHVKPSKQLHCVEPAGVLAL